MSGKPVTHHESLEAQLALEKVVEDIRVLASLRVVDLIVLYSEVLVKSIVKEALAIVPST